MAAPKTVGADEEPGRQRGRGDPTITSPTPSQQEYPVLPDSDQSSVGKIFAQVQWATTGLNNPQIKAEVNPPYSIAGGPQPGFAPDSHDNVSNTFTWNGLDGAYCDEDGTDEWNFLVVWTKDDNSIWKAVTASFAGLDSSSFDRKDGRKKGTKPQGAAGKYTLTVKDFSNYLAPLNDTYELTLQRAHVKRGFLWQSPPPKNKKPITVQMWCECASPNPMDPTFRLVFLMGKNRVGYTKAGKSGPHPVQIVLEIDDKTLPAPKTVTLNQA
jgi:hypothetical protein